jgi:HEPN domain-containing protein
MSQDEAILIWKNGAIDAWDTFETLFSSKKYLHALFFLHLALEKLLKAIIIKQTDQPAPVVHDLIRLAEKINLTIDNQVLSELGEISTFNVAARYDDTKLQLYKKATIEYTQKWKMIGKFWFDRLLKLL